MAHTSTHRSLPIYLIETGLPLLLPAVAFVAVILSLALYGQPAAACEPTVHYIVTGSETTAVDLEMPLTDNLDYERDHVRTDPDAELGCDALTMTATDGYVYAWHECVVPASEAPDTSAWL